MSSPLREPFTPSRSDGRAFHQVIFEHVTDLIARGQLAPGDIITHAHLANMAEMEYPSSSYFQAVAKASRQLQESSHQILVSVRGEGYKLVRGMGMIDVGRREQSRAKRQMSKALVTVRSVDEAHLATADERVTLAQVRKGFSIIGNVLGQQAEAIAQHDEEINLLKNARQADSARLAALEAQLDRLRGGA